MSDHKLYKLGETDGIQTKRSLKLLDISVTPKDYKPYNKIPLIRVLLF